MASVNKVILIGNLGQDPELRMAGTKPVCNFTMATNEAHDRVEWHRVTCWEKVAENVVKYLSKGSKVYVEGRLQTREWEDKQGNKRYTTEISAYTVQFLDSKKGGGAPAPQSEEIPF